MTKNQKDKLEKILMKTVEFYLNYNSRTSKDPFRYAANSIITDAIPIADELGFPAVKSKEVIKWVKQNVK